MATGSQSLVNMTVAGDNSGGNQGLLMPKLQYRFRVNFLNFGVDTATQQLTKQVIDITRPSVSFGEITIPVYNSTMYLAGRHEWQPLTVNIRDDASGSVAKLVGQQLQKQMMILIILVKILQFCVILILQHNLLLILEQELQIIWMLICM